SLVGVFLADGPSLVPGEIAELAQLIEWILPFVVSRNACVKCSLHPSSLSAYDYPPKCLRKGTTFRTVQDGGSSAPVWGRKLILFQDLWVLRGGSPPPQPRLSISKNRPPRRSAAPHLPTNHPKSRG